MRRVILQGVVAAAAGAGGLLLAGGVAGAQNFTVADPGASCPLTSPGHSRSPGGAPLTSPGGSSSPSSTGLYGYYTAAATTPLRSAPLAFTGFDAAGASVVALGLVTAGGLVVRLSRLGGVRPE